MDFGESFVLPSVCEHTIGYSQTLKSQKWPRFLAQCDFVDTINPTVCMPHSKSITPFHGEGVYNTMWSRNRTRTKDV